MGRRQAAVEGTRTAGRLLLALLLFGGASYPIWAHNYLPPPQRPGAVTVIPDITVSRAAYRELTPGQPVTRYTFHARAGQSVYIQMTIPQIPRLARFSPSFAVVTGAANWDTVVPDLLLRGTVAIRDPKIRSLLGLHPGQFAMTVSSDGAAPVPFHEPVTDTGYWLAQTIRFAAPATGEYEIDVFDPHGQTGKYVLATGEKEHFTLRDLLDLGKVRRIVRAFMEVKR